MTYDLETCCFYGCNDLASFVGLDVGVYLGYEIEKVDSTSLYVCPAHRAWLLGGIAEISKTGLRYEAGLVREAGEAYNPTAVRWWVFSTDGDGFFFARGGREPTEQAADAELASALGQLGVERAAWKNRRTHELLETSIVRRFSHELMPDGSLRPLVPTDWEVDR